MEKPCLLITCRAGNEEWCTEEIGNTIFPYDPNVRIERTRYPGLLLVYSKLSPATAYSIAMRREYGFVTRIIPVMVYGETSDPSILNKILDLVKDGERLKLRVRVRGKRGLSEKLWNNTIAILKKKNVVHDPSSHTCLYVEVIDDHFFIGKARC